jgi:hypothetical protein
MIARKQITKKLDASGGVVAISRQVYIKYALEASRAETESKNQ